MREVVRNRTGFSLVEVLVATAVLTLMVGLLASSMGGVSSAWQKSREKMDNFARGRSLLGAMDRDIRNAVIRQDLPAFPATTIDGKPALAFFTRSFGQESDTGNLRPLTYVSYFSGTNSMVTRRDVPFDFNTTLAEWDPFGPKTSATPAGLSVPDRQLCGGVLVFHFDYLQSDGTISTTFAGLPLKTGDPKQIDPAKPRTVAIRLSLAIIGDQAQGILRQMNKESSLISALEGKAGTGRSAKEAWDAYLLEGGVASLNLPADVLSGLRTYQKIVRLDLPPTYVTQ